MHCTGSGIVTAELRIISDIVNASLAFFFQYRSLEVDKRSFHPHLLWDLTRDSGGL